MSVEHALLIQPEQLGDREPVAVGSNGPKANAISSSKYCIRMSFSGACVSMSARMVDACKVSSKMMQVVERDMLPSVGRHLNKMRRVRASRAFGIIALACAIPKQRQDYRDSVT